MSSRAVRRLREERERREREEAALDIVGEEGDGDDSDECSSDEEEVGGGKKAFLLMMDDSSTDDSSEDGDEDGDGDGDDDKDDDDDDDEDKASKESVNKSNKDKQITIDENSKSAIKKEEVEEEEDIDAILSEFQIEHELNRGDNGPSANKPTNENSKEEEEHLRAVTRIRKPYEILRSNIDPRDYDMDQSLRNMAPLDRADGNNRQRRGAQTHNQRRQRQLFLFGKPREEWGRRPPSRVGGGLGSNIDVDVDVDVDVDETTEGNKPMPPWPHCHCRHLHRNPSHGTPSISWHALDPSVTYANTLSRYRTEIESSGDANLLALFVADHPHLVEPLLALSEVLLLHADRRRDQGTDLLRRAAWILECALPPSILPPSTSTTTATYAANTTLALMDGNNPNNQILFDTFFRLVKCCSAVGCFASALAVSRFILSLDLHNDPAGLLMLMDYFALASDGGIGASHVGAANDASEDANLEFLIRFVECGMVEIYHDRDMSATDERCKRTRPPSTCNLIDMPNWAYSYALALYRTSLNHPTEKTAEKAATALHNAIRMYPTVPSLILDKNGIDVVGRSTRTDWPSVLGVLTEWHILGDREKEQHGDDNSDGKEGIDNVTDDYTRDEWERGKRASERIIQIYIERSYHLWSLDDVIQWLYDGCAAVAAVVMAEETERMPRRRKPPPALARYMRFDPDDYSRDVPRALLPADVVPLDPAVLELALRPDPNRGRLLRRQRRGHGGDGGGDNEELQRRMEMMMAGGAGAGAEGNALLGRGRNGMVVIDPDLPVTEVFWRSLMPWARVDGVPPPPPP